MVYQHAALGLTYTTVASNLNVDTSTVCRTLQLFRRTGQVTKKQYDGTNLIYKLTDEVQLILLEVVLALRSTWLLRIAGMVGPMAAAR